MSNPKLDNVEAQRLLVNIAEVLKLYTLPEVNDILVHHINKKSGNVYAEKYILDLVCDTYKVSYRALVYSKSNPSVTRARQVAYCLLHYTLGLSVRHIAKRVFHFDHHNSVGSAINMYKKLNPKLAPDKEFKESIDMLREKVMTKIQESEK